MALKIVIGNDDCTLYNMIAECSMLWNFACHNNISSNSLVLHLIHQHTQLFPFSQGGGEFGASAFAKCDPISLCGSVVVCSTLTW